MDAEMIEKVARAIQAAHEPLRGGWDDLAPHGVVHYTNVARAAIAALSATPKADYKPTLCEKCGEPTMHLGRTCYACSHQPATPQAAQVPAGYALVPVEPTEAMLDAAGVCPVPAGKEWLDKSNREVWAAMLAAAQAQGVGRG